MCWLMNTVLLGGDKKNGRIFFKPSSSLEAQCCQLKDLFMVGRSWGHEQRNYFLSKDKILFRKVNNSSKKN